MGEFPIVRENGGWKWNKEHIILAIICDARALGGLIKGEAINRQNNSLWFNSEFRCGI